METERGETPEPEMNSREILVERVLPVELSAGDGRTIEARIVPYGTVARVADPPHYEPYDEMWVHGAFERQTNAAHRVKVLMDVEHEDGIRGVVGHGQTLVDRSDGLYGTFRIHENLDGDKALHLVNEGLLEAVSLKAFVTRSSRVDGVVQRLRARLDRVSLCREPAYEQALILAVRSADGAASDDEIKVELSESVVDAASLNEAIRAGLGREPTVDVTEVARSLEPNQIDTRLEALGFERLVKRAVVRKPWDGSPSRFTDEEYQRSCLIDRGGDAPPKERCSLPVLEPNGDLNVNALGAAAGVLAGARGGAVNVPLTKRASAARKLMRLYGQAAMEPPPSLRAIAAR